MISFSPTDNPIIAGIRALYGIAKEIDKYVDELITTMKQSANKTIAQAGRVIDSAKYGFGIGFIVPIAIIAIGQLILGNTFQAVVTVATSPVNPVAMTCAAIGAVYYGWSALSESEKGAIIDRLKVSLEIGSELIKAIVQFVIGKARELMSSEALDDFKAFVSDAAFAFGRSLADVTRSIKDRASEAYGFVADKLKNDVDDTPKELPRLPI